MKLKELFAVIVLYRFNFQNLHWNSVGENFNDAHKEITKEYYEKLDGTMDTIGEMLCRLGENPMNLKEVLDTFAGSEKNYLLVDSKDLYDRTAIVKNADIMLTDICNLLAECIQDEVMQSPINAGMRSDLEAILNDYDIEARFLNKRRIGVPTIDATVVAAPAIAASAEEPEVAPEDEAPVAPEETPEVPEDIDITVEDEEVPAAEDGLEDDML
jgi:DNA-binding ferritin-like protein